MDGKRPPQRRSARLQKTAPSTALVIVTPTHQKKDREQQPVREPLAELVLAIEYPEYWDDSLIGSLPVEVLQAMAGHLSFQDLAASRTACRYFARHIAAGLTSFESRLHPDVDTARQQAYEMRRIAPHLQRLTLIVSSRVSQPAFDAYIGHLRATGPPLQELTVTTVSPVLPKNGPTPRAGESRYAQAARLTSYVALARLTGLTAVTLNQGVMPCGASLEALTALKGLTRLVLNTQPHNIKELKEGQDDPFLANERAVWALSRLRGLRHLVFHTKLWDITLLTLLPHLQHLEAHGARLSSLALTHFATSCTELQVFKVGVSPVSNMTESEVAALCPARRERPAEVHLSLYGRTEEAKAEVQHLHRQLGGSLAGLTLEACLVKGEVLEALGCVTSLKSLQISDPEVLGSGLGPLASLSHLTRFSLSKSAAAARTCLATELPRLFRSWPLLQRLDLEGLDCDDLPPTAGRALACLTHLHTLTLHGANTTRHMLQVDLGWLPPSLRCLSLRFFSLGCPTFHSRLRGLEELKLSHCSLGCLPHLQSAVESLVGLRRLDLHDMQGGFSDTHLAALGQLTGLTTLKMSDITNHRITNAGLAGVTRLAGLMQLQWHTGDALDHIPDTELLKSFPLLHVLHLTSSTLWRFNRWHAMGILAFLPFLDLENTHL